jgi:pimeloyl-ACP methyl ester carboxylesterase
MEPLELQHGDLTLRGTRYPGGRAGHVLLAHGFSSNRMGNNRMFVELARALAAEGFDVMSFDRAGHGESDGRFFDVNVPDELAQLSAMCDLAPRPVHLVGHSLGGMESATLAGRRPDAIASLTLLAPAAASVDEVADGKILGRPYGLILAGEPFDVNGQAIGPAFVRGMEGYDAYAGLSAYRGAVFLHHGEADEVVPFRYAERYRAVWPQARLTSYPGGDHGWQTLPLRERLIETCVREIAEIAAQAS